MKSISHKRDTKPMNSFWMQFEYVNNWCVLINSYYKRNIALEIKYNLYEIGMKYGQNKQKISEVSWVGFFWSRIRPWFYYILQLSLSCFVSNIRHSPHIHHSGTLTSRVKLTNEIHWVPYTLFMFWVSYPLQLYMDSRCTENLVKHLPTNWLVGHRWSTNSQVK